jgi:RHS repeat-associated protein
MKHTFVCAILLPACGALLLATDGFSAELPARVLKRERHQRIVQTASGGAYTEMADGLCYQDERGNWFDSEELFEIIGTTAVARRGQHKVTLAANINSERVVELIAPDGKRFVSRFAGLSYFDAASGQNILLARVQDSIGVIHPPNQVIYPAALAGDGFTADVRYTWRKGSFEQDVILREPPPSPEAFQMNPATTRLQAWTMFVEAPEPEVYARILRKETDAAARQVMVEPDFADQELKFGALAISLGQAFSLGQDKDVQSIPVGKEWGSTEAGETFLIESLEYPAAKSRLDELSEKKAASIIKEGVSNLAARRLSRSQLMAALAKPIVSQAAGEGQMQVAQTDSPARPGFVIDYITVYSGYPHSYNNHVFQSGQTYYLSGPITLTGTAVLEGGSVLKLNGGSYGSTGGLRVDSGSSIKSIATAWNPCIITAMDDNTVGEVIAGSTGTPVGAYGGSAIHIQYASAPVSLAHIRVRYATIGMNLQHCSGLHEIRHSQFINCGKAFQLYNTTLQPRNVLVANNAGYTSGSVVSGDGSSTLRAENMTVHSAGYLRAYMTSASVYLTNTLLVGVGSAAYTGGINNQTIASDTGVFQTPPVGAGARYLANNTYRNLGTDQINPDLLTELRQRTTYPPLVLSSDFTTPQTLAARSLGDVDQIDLGYHYEILDYAWSGRNLTSALLLTNGVAVAHFGTRGTTLGAGAKFISEGSPASRNHLAPYSMVQENPAAWGTSGSTFAIMGTSGSQVSPAPQVYLRFTDVSFPAGLPPKRQLVEHANGNLPQSLALRDCELSAAYLIVSNSVSGATDFTAALTNNLFRRVLVTLRRDANTPLVTHLYNNLFINSTLGLLRNLNTGTAWEVHDNLFDTASLTAGSAAVANSHNGYLATTALPSGAANITITTRNYQNGPFGTNYYPATPLVGSFSDLINVGSRSASDAGLYHYTTTGPKDAGQVDIGYHFMATTGTQPTDTDSDGKPDYQEDPNGNGKTDGDEDSWFNPIITFNPTPMNYPVGWPSQIIDAAAVVTDADSPDPINIGGGTLTATLQSGGQPDDFLTIRNWGTGTKQIGTNVNGMVTYSGVNIGTFSIGTHSTPLHVVFNANAKLEAAQAILTNLCFHSSNSQPSTTQRTVQLMMTDGRGGASSPATKAIHLSMCVAKVDAAILLDVSQSFNTSPDPKGMQAFSYQKASAVQFVRQLGLPGLDRGALLPFCGSVVASGVVSLTTQEQTLLNGINAFVNESHLCGGTRFDLPVDEARTMLLNNPRDGAPQLIFLLTDGQTSFANEARASALRARELGLRLITVGLGTHADIDVALLRDMATLTGDYLRAEYTELLAGQVSLIAQGFCRGNDAPIVSISGPSEINFGTTATLTGAATDDGLPANVTLVTSWALVSGPGAVTLTPAAGNPLQVSASFTQPGVFQIRLSASDSVYSGSATHTITVNKANVAPTVDAGPDQMIELPMPVYLPGSATDDSVPFPANLSVVWSVIQGSAAAVTFENATSPATMVSFSSTGTYQLRLTANDGTLSSFDDVTVVVTAATGTWTFNNVNYVSAGVGGLRGTLLPRSIEGGTGQDSGGTGVIKLNGVSGTVIKALLCWHGPTGVPNLAANAHVLVNGKLAVGKNMGQAGDNGWGIVAEFLNSQSYVADVTGVVKTWGNGAYEIRGLFKAREVDINGASLVVVYDNPSLARTNVVIVAGNDSNNGQDNGAYWSGDIRAIELANGNIVAGGTALNVHGLGTHAVLEFSDSGTINDELSPSAEPNWTVNALAPHPHGIMIAGFVGSGSAHKLKLYGELNDIAVADGEIKCVAVQGDGKVLIGGNFTQVNGVVRQRLARLQVQGGTWTVDPLFHPEVSGGTVNALVLREPTPGEVYIYFGGTFSSVNQANRDQVALVDSMGDLDSGYAQNLSLGGYMVNSLAIDTNARLLVGGSFGLRRINATGTALDATFNSAITHPISVVRLQLDGRILVAGTSAAPDNEPYLARLLQSGQMDLTFRSVAVDGAVQAIALQGTKIMIGGRFQLVNQGLMRGIARLLSDGSLDTTFAPSKAGWFNQIPAPAYTGSGAWIELHVADGQHALDNARYEDYDLYLNGSPWVLTGTQPICPGVQINQIFAGTSVPLRHSDDCAYNRGLWDIRAFPVDSSHLANSPPHLIISSAAVGEQLDSGVREDAVSIVLKTLLYPSTGPNGSPAAVAPRTDGRPFAVSDGFMVRRDVGRRVLHVLGNDWSVDGKLLRISGVTAPTHGRAEVIYGDSAIAYTASDTFTGVDQFTYTVTDTHGNDASAVVQVTVDNAPPATATSSTSVAGTLEVTDRLSFVRGGGQRADFYRLPLLARQTVCISRTSGINSHFYLLDRYGELVASGNHVDAGIKYLVAESGDYTLEVTSHGVSDLGPYALEFTIDSCFEPKLRIYVGNRRVDGTTFDFGIETEQTFTIVNERLTTSQEIGVSTSGNPTFSVDQVLLQPLPPGGRANVVVSRSPVAQAQAELSVGDGPAHDVIKVTLTGSAVANGASVTITDPRNNGLFTHPASIPVNVTATPAPGQAVAKVELFVKGAAGRYKVDQTTQLSGGAYTLVFAGGPSGTYDLVATMTQGNGAKQNSPPVRVGIASGTGNSSPVAVNDAISVAVNTATRIDVLANDFDVDGDPIEITSAQSLNGIGEVQMVEGNRRLLYTPPPNTYGSARITYGVKDLRNGTARAHVDVHIVNQAVGVNTWPLDTPFFSSETGQPDVMLVASATTSHGAITKVEFFANNVKVGESGAPTTAPTATPSDNVARFRLTWRPKADGFYRITARALSDSGFATRSEAITIGINPPPGTEIHAPEISINNLTDDQVVREGAIPVYGMVEDNTPTLRYRLDLLKPVASYDDAPAQSWKLLANLTPPLRDEEDGFKEGGVPDGGLLGTLDCSMLPNGVYLVRLTADNGLVPPISTEVRIMVDNQIKVGQLAFQEQDLLIPVAGIPISVVRSYDSFNTNALANNFGVGWTLGVNDLQVELDEERQPTKLDPDDPMSPWVSMRVGGGRNVTLTLPDGRRATFAFSLVPGKSDENGTSCLCYEAKWIAPPGVFATLVPKQDNRLQYIPFQSFIGPYWAAGGPQRPYEHFDFNGFWLTNVDGTVYEISRAQLHDGAIELGQAGNIPQEAVAYGQPRLTAIRTLAGDRLEIGDIAGSAADALFDVKHLGAGEDTTPTTSIRFKRDGYGRIYEIYDPISLSLEPSTPVAVVRYEYYGAADPNGANGNLKRVRRLKTRETLTYEDTTYEYKNLNYPFLITAIVNSQGTRTLVKWDSSGRFTGFAQPLPWSEQKPLVSVAHDLAGRTETITDGEGRTSTHQYDVHGNVVRSVNALGETVLRSYDAQGSLRSETDPAGATSHFGYDTFGNQTAATNALGQRTEAQFNRYGQITMMRDGRGHSSFNTYATPTGNLLTSTDANGKATLLGYDAATQWLTKTEDALENITVHEYYTATGSDGRRGDLKSVKVRQLIDGNANPKVYKTLSQTDYTYDANGNRLTEKVWRDVSVDLPADSATTTYRYDGQNRLVETEMPPLVAGATPYVTKTEYNAQGKVEKTHDALNRVTQYDYDIHGNLIQTRFPSDAQTPATVSRTVYDANNRPIFVQDRVAIGSDPYAPTEASGTRTIYDAAGRVVRSERLWTFRVELQVELQGEEEHPSGLRKAVDFPVIVEPGRYGEQFVVLSATETRYDEAGRVAATIDARANATTYEYDILGRRVGVRDALDNLSSYEYDENGNQTAFVDAAEPVRRRTTYVYDNVNRRTEVHPVQGNPELTEYDALGRGFKQTDQENKVTLIEYDALGRVTAVTNAFGTPDQAVTRYIYDGAGNLVEQLDANQSIKPLAQQNPVRFTYDKLNRRIRRQLPDGQYETLGYDAVGNLKAHTNFAWHAGGSAPNQHVIDFEYDVLNRLKKKYDRALGANHISAVSFEYNVLGQRTKMLDGSREMFPNGFTSTTPTRYSYDKFNRLESIKREEWPGQDGAYVREYLYDFNGNVTQIETVGSGNIVYYAYDPLNRLTHVTNYPAVTRYEYDAVGNLKAVKLPNGIETGYDYDALNRLTLANTVKRLSPTSTAPRASFDYATAGLSGTGKRFGVNETVNGITRVVRYAYDDRYRLKEEKLGVSAGVPTIGYAYDKVGNRKQRTSTVDEVPPHLDYQYNGNDWLTSYGAEGLPTSFDANGNTLLGEVTPAQTADDEYDYENRLTKRTLTDRTIELIYDGDGHRVGRIVTQGGQVRTTRYLIDERNPTGYAQALREDMGVNTGALPAGEVAWRYYVYGLDLISVYDNSVTRYYGYDGHGSTRFLTDEAGTITDTYKYDAFGILTGSTENATTKNSYLFAGEYFDRELGQYHNRARTYNQNTGRFWTMDTHEGTQTDPLSLHKYLYAHADPVNNIDPSGQFTLGELLTTTATMLRMAAQAGFGMYQTYNRAAAAYDAIQDVALVTSMLGDGDVDEDESDLLHEMINGYVRSRVQAHAIRVVSGAGGRALGAAAGRVGRMRITQAGIQRTREWYRKHKLRYANSTAQTVAGPVPFDRHGWPNFSNYLYKGGKGQNTVRIQLTGSRREDFKLANKAAGFGDSATAHPAGYTWHHNQKLGKMELVRQDAHSPNANGNEWHDGAVAIFKRLYGWGYND